MSGIEPEFEPETEVDPTDGIYEGDAVEVLEDAEENPTQEYVDSERVVDEPDEPDAVGEPDEEL